MGNKKGLKNSLFKKKYKYQKINKMNKMIQCVPIKIRLDEKRNQDTL